MKKWKIFYAKIGKPLWQHIILQILQKHSECNLTQNTTVTSMVVKFFMPSRLTPELN